MAEQYLGGCAVMAFVGVSDAARAREFYGGKLGLPLVSEDLPFALVYDANGTMLRVTMVGKPVTAGYTVLGWRVPSAVNAVTALSRAGVGFERYEGLQQDELGIWTAPGGTKVAWFKDPDGNTLSVSEH